MDSSYPCYQRTTTKNQEIGGVKECRITNKLQANPEYTLFITGNYEVNTKNDVKSVYTRK